MVRFTKLCKWDIPPYPPTYSTRVGTGGSPSFWTPCKLRSLVMALLLRMQLSHSGISTGRENLRHFFLHGRLFRYSSTSSNSNVFNMQPGSITLSIHFYFRDSKDSHTWKHFKQYKIYLKTVLDINTSTVWRRMWILGMLRTCELLSEWYA